MAAELATVDREDFEETLVDGNLGDEGDLEEDDASTGNSGWADAMARILGKHLPSDKPPVLAKYKKGEKRKTEEKEEIKQKKLKSRERHEMLEKDHVIPDKCTADYEKTLMKIATKGVVKLFNAVSKHQKEMDAKLKSAPTEAKKSKVVESMSKSAFLDMLKSSSDKTRNKTNAAFQQQTKDGGRDEGKGASWEILRDDFMLGAKMKDWDREEEEGDRRTRKVHKSNMEDYVLENQEELSEESDEDQEEISEDGD